MSSSDHMDLISDVHQKGAWLHDVIAIFVKRLTWLALRCCSRRVGVAAGVRQGLDRRSPAAPYPHLCR